MPGKKVKGVNNPAWITQYTTRFEKANSNKQHRIASQAKTWDPTRKLDAWWPSLNFTNVDPRPHIFPLVMSAYTFCDEHERGCGVWHRHCDTDRQATSMTLNTILYLFPVPTDTQFVIADIQYRISRSVYSLFKHTLRRLIPSLQYYCIIVTIQH